ncbi:hypothetical protein H4W34_005678 [Actinomadura algeriensis]|uniref:Uncharacterized protein n=1 Tax=Actinomadura algeriensis TaxID=1679523 RepID=A0ABR9K0F9_9ACTN|nr:hypothetical protein [Actinomadura algeriensis]
MREQHGHRFLDRHTGDTRDHDRGYRPEPRTVTYRTVTLTECAPEPRFARR